MSERFYLRIQSDAGPLHYAAVAGAPHWTPERTAAWPFTSRRRARRWRRALGLTPTTCRVVRVGPKRPAPPASADAAALREVLAEILAGEDGSAAPFRHDGNGPGHAHSVPGRWDRDNSPCAWCALWARAAALVAEKASLAAPVAPGRAGGTADARVAVPSQAARPEGSGEPEPGGFQVGDRWADPRGMVYRVTDEGFTGLRLRWNDCDVFAQWPKNAPPPRHLRLVERAGKPWPPVAS